MYLCISTRSLLLLVLIGCCIPAVAIPPLQGPPSQAGSQANEPSSSGATVGKPPGAPYRNQPARMAKRAVLYYQSLWGVDSFTVKWAESGEIIRFSYRVVDAEKAIALHDKKAQPQLDDPQAGVSLVVPTMEKVGQLRQTSTPEAGRFYWMAFSNQGRRVKRGDRVNVVIGNFHADGLEVQ
jgi:hypothetical protein